MSAKGQNVGQSPRVPVTALIIALIMALAAPSLAFVAILLFQTDVVTRRQLEARAEQGVGAISRTVDRELRSMVTNLSVFAASGWIEIEEYDRLHARATAALEPSGAYLAAVDENAQQILNTRVPWGTPLQPLTNPGPIREALATGQPVVSDVFVGNLARAEVFNLTLPILSGQTRVKALNLSRSTASLAAIFRENLPPPGWTYAVLDRQGKLVSGTAPADAPEDVFARLCGAGTKGLREQRVNGVTFSATSETVEPWGWRACVWTSSGEFDAGMAQRWRNFTILTIVVVLVAILSGAALGQMLAGAIRRAANVGRALDAGGDVPQMHSMVREVDDVLGTLTRAARRRLSHEQEQAVLLSETAHRAKNQIAIASALTRLSARSARSVEQLRDDIVARLGALGQSIDMMAKSPSGAVSLAELIEAQLEPFRAGREQLELKGATVNVSPTTAQSLGLVFHEMATNAAKYGAWSSPTGRVCVSWTRQPDGGLVLEWREEGGPPPSPPSRVGFGSSLIEMMVERTLGGEIKRDYAPTGLVATFTLKPEGPLG